MVRETMVLVTSGTVVVMLLRRGGGIDDHRGFLTLVGGSESWRRGCDMPSLPETRWRRKRRRDARDHKPCPPRQAASLAHRQAA
jgi:hypothetical protein